MPLNAPLKSVERVLFDRKVLGLEPDEVAQFWINRRIRDEGFPPRTLPSTELGLRVVASYAGAIAYVSSKIVKGGVRVLKLDGKLPTDPGYLLTERRGLPSRTLPPPSSGFVWSLLTLERSRMCLRRSCVAACAC